MHINLIVLLWFYTGIDLMGTKRNKDIISI